MGGGPAMRAAAKVAGITTFTTPLRGTGVADTVAAQNGARPVSAGLSSMAPTCDDYIVVDRNSMSMPRVVFGPVPTIEETKEATSQLKDVLDLVYISSPKSVGTGESVSSVNETKACIHCELLVPKSANAMQQACKLLKENPAVQSVVASIASDRNVWDAVMKNPALVEFVESQKKSTAFESPKFHSENFVSSSIDSLKTIAPEEPNRLVAFLENVKGVVVDVVQYLTNSVKSFFSSPTVEQRDGFADEKLDQNCVVGSSIMLLVLMVIMVVVWKRS